jgi:hypothetical protein
MTMPPGNRPPYGQPPQGPYPPVPLPYQVPPPGYYAPLPQKTNWWAVVSLVCGVLGVVLISVICGIVALSKTKQGQDGRGMAIAGLVLSGLWVLLLVAGVAIFLVVRTDTVTVTMDNVKVGDCLAELPDRAVSTVQTVECDQPHAGEVFAVLMMPKGDFPGQDAIDAYHDKCEPALASYAPDVITDDSVQLYILSLTEQAWRQGDRSVICIAEFAQPRTGSIKG